MSNSYFQFKQFIIHQDKCAMKVCTDACLFGAYLSNYILINNKLNQQKNILDIGTGTGLLSLMIAQKNNASVDAVEIDEDAYHQAKQNILQSPFKNNIHFHHNSIINFKSKNYDIILSNPPFFENDLQSKNHQKNIAKHHASLTLNELIIFANKNIVPDGKFAVLLPYHRMKYFTNIALQHNFYLNNQILIKQRSKHPFFRCILILSKTLSEIITEEILIKNQENNYSPEFISLLKDYYLNL